MVKVDFPYVHVRRNRHGKLYPQFRKKGMKSVPLPMPIGGKPFMEAYGQCLEDSPAPNSHSPLKVKPGSMAALVHAWYESGDFKQLRESTRTTYRGIMNRFLINHGGKPVARLERKHIAKIIGGMTDTPAAANNLLARLKQIMRFALENDWIKVDPTQGVRKVRYRVKGFHTWTEEDAAKFVAFHPPGTKPNLAFMILSHTGVRRSDVVRLGRGNIRDDTIVLVQQKNSEPVIIPLSPALAQTLGAITDRVMFLQTEYGKPFTAAGFGNWMRRQCDRAGLPECSSHGLRKLIATRLAEAGCGENQISAILGWANNKQAALYTKAANKERMARAGMKAIG